jgi:hypothetical protein
MEATFRAVLAGARSLLARQGQVVDSQCRFRDLRFALQTRAQGAQSQVPRGMEGYGYKDECHMTTPFSMGIIFDTSNP